MNERSTLCEIKFGCQWRCSCNQNSFVIMLYILYIPVLFIATYIYSYIFLQKSFIYTYAEVLKTYILQLYSGLFQCAHNSSYMYVCTMVWKIFVEKYFVFKKVRVKNISWLLFAHENFLTTK